MRCDQIDTLLDAYIDGEWSTVEAGLPRARMEAHLAQCAACRAELESRRALRRACREALPTSGAPADLRARIQAAASSGATSSQPANHRVFRRRVFCRRTAWPLALAAAASLALVILVPNLLPRRQDGDQPPAFSTPARVIVPRYGERAGRTMPARFGGIDLVGGIDSGEPSQRRSP
ncbi:hypothetical protein CSA17_06190 [bacterium DOLJORAL78_65_58]|nr:MAG: hypothetical protein CSB20_07785 [bacterium DOLZORAL124_64_63]PIE75682.1 MAG: hypothetical protein CSA17_06190 [bacterium DOLJORAL78_65_58]